MIRAGVIGFGSAGRIFHAAVISAVEGLELAAIVARSGEAAARAYPAVKIARSVEELLADASIRLIAVATPNSTHFPIARQCLLADRDVVIDKPFAVSSAEAAELTRLARSRGRLLTVYQNRRWDGDFRTVRALLERSSLGQLVLYESHFDRFRPQLNFGVWRENGDPGGGTLLDLGSHLVDQALTAFGLPETIWADVRMERENARSDDAFDICLGYPPSHDGHAAPRVWLRATTLARAPGPRFILNGTRGTYRKFGLDPQEDRLRAGDLFATSPWGTEAEEHWGRLTEDIGGKPESRLIPTEAGDYRGYYANVRDALLGVVPLEVTPVQAWRTMRTLEMARESSRKGCAVACEWGMEP